VTARTLPGVTEPAIELTDAVTLLGRFPALAGVSLRVERGEVVALQGPNGAGKSTLLGLCAGLLRLDRGTGAVLGLDLRSQRTAVRRRVGLLAHRTALYDDLTVEENLQFWAKATRAGVPDAHAALRRIGVDERLADVPVRLLSAGQRRRTALAVLVVRRPELWLLDEPHAALDQDGRDRVDQLIIEAAAAGGTVVVASHELERVGRLNPRVVTIAGGTASDAA
jgi:heme ABC exporter ATP-binding subunit CcmA